MEKPIVSICCITYNHVKFLVDCIDGFLFQKTKFPIEILIFDDASTDGSQEIIKKYAEQDSRITTFLQSENQWSKQRYGFIDWLFPSAHGKYIALCEGDDYWTDPFKLQKQVDFLERNEAYGLVFTNYLKRIDTEFFENDKKFNSYQNLDTYFQDGLPFLFTGSWLMKNDLVSLKLIDSKFGILPGDVQILCHILALGYGIHYFNESMGVYRVLNESASHSLANDKNKDFALVKFLLLLKYKSQLSKFVLTHEIEKLIIKNFHYFGSFQLGLRFRLDLLLKLIKLKGLSRALRFLFFNIS